MLFKQLLLLGILVSACATAKKEDVSVEVGTAAPTKVPKNDFSVKHAVMQPATNDNQNYDEIEVVVAPSHGVAIEMPQAIQFLKSSSSKSLYATPFYQEKRTFLSIEVTPVSSPTKMSLLVLDVSGNIYSFSILAIPDDRTWNYPQTIIVTQRQPSNNTEPVKEAEGIGSKGRPEKKNDCN